MSFCFHHSEPLSAGVVRIGTELLERSVNHLEDWDTDPDAAVHNARKRLKEVRALLRLFSKEMGKELFRKENRIFREQGRKLSGIRDRAVAGAVLRRLLGVDAEEAYARNLLHLLEASPQGREETAADIRAVAAALAAGSSRISGWHLDEDLDSVKSGLRRTYHAGREAFEKASTAASDENLHEWRKRVKDLWYHVQLVRQAAPPVLEPFATILHELSDRLGDDHDLAILQLKLRENREVVNELPGRDRLLTEIRRQRKQFQVEARRLGEMVYAEKPKCFAARVDTYWKSWRAPSSKG